MLTDKKENGTLNYMNEINSLDEHILMQASNWFAVLQDENVSEADKNEWLAWLHSDKKHQQAWAQIESITGTFQHVSDLPNAKNIINKHPVPARKLTSLFSLCLIVGVPIIAFNFFSQTSAHFTPEHYQTAIGETREIILKDGSKVWLNTNSELTVLFTEKLRQINLVNGEVFIKTAKDMISTHRPFNVMTKNGELTALGTEFTVRQSTQLTELTVYKGAVRIAAQHNDKPLILAAGQQTSFSDTLINNKTIPASPIRKSWTKGVLIADNTPLCDFMVELNRYTIDKIICPTALNQYQLVGSYPLNDINAVFTAIDQSLPTYTWRVNSTTIRIDKK